MKKLLCVLLAAIFLLAACTPEGNESVTDVSGTVSGDENTVPGVSYTLTKESIDKMLADRADVLKGEALRKGERVNEAAGKNYTLNTATVEKFPNTKGVLTDGEFKDTHYKFVKTGWVGLAGASASVTVDLGKKINELCDFEISSCINNEYGVALCEAMFVYVSDDGEGWKNIGIYQTSGAEADKAKHLLCVNVRGTVSARYVKFVFEGIHSEYFIIDEIGV